MSKELECLDRIDKRNYLTEREHKEFLRAVEQALKRLESIDNSKLNEALENLKYLKNLTKVKDVLNVPFWNESYEIVEKALLKVQEPKKYLKWEDLEFEENKLKKLKVRMGSHIYTLEYQSYKNKMDNLIEIADLWVDQRCISRDLGKYVFDDLRLEVIEE